jgi:hypothetical protein
MLSCCQNLINIEVSGKSEQNSTGEKEIPL